MIIPQEQLKLGLESPHTDFSMGLALHQGVYMWTCELQVTISEGLFENIHLNN